MINIRSITKDEMTRLTTSADYSEKIDTLYLSWEMMNWNLVGEIRKYYIDNSDLFLSTDNSVQIFFPSKNFKILIYFLLVASNDTVKCL